ncbi:MAG: nucleoside deaminase [Planctomycetota bacterium]|nr:nucleoside deaminase [Planctomycetota bacterium]
MLARLSPPSEELQERAIEVALEEARQGMADGEVPVGAAVLDGEGVLLSQAHNEIEGRGDPTAHAERLALSGACQKLGHPRLPEGSLVVSTLEPCAMCAGALVLARPSWLLLGAMDPKAGACGSVFNVISDERLNHHVHLLPTRESEVCGELLQRFFQDRR